ncbi:MAG: hypothetical protein F9K40_03965 [Kofleriaceae bacterium]|nr:MAG: hypothetical protein F9K40_03965 [Kofleriaceae bacterium]
MGGLGNARGGLLMSIITQRLAWLVLGFAVLVVSEARADETLPRPVVEGAQVHFDAGNRAFRSAQARTDPAVQRTEYEMAIKEYLAGLQLETKFHYTFYWNLGHAYRQLGQYTRADHFYKKFLEYAPARFTLHRTAAEDFRRMMKAELDKAASLAEPNAPAPAPLRGPQAKSERMDLRDRASSRLAIGAIVGGIGGALVVGGVIKLSIHDRGRGREHAQVSLTPGGLVVSGRF